MRLGKVKSLRVQSFKSRLGILVPLHRLKNGNVLCWQLDGNHVIRVNKDTKIGTPQVAPTIPEYIDVMADRRISEDTPKRKRRSKRKRSSHWPCTINGTTFSSYKTYLKSDIWANRRAIFADGYEMRCGYCENTCKKPNLHHLSYANIGHEKDTDLVWLCRTCHDCVHSTDYKGELKRFRK